MAGQILSSPKGHAGLTDFNSLVCRVCWIHNLALLGSAVSNISDYRCTSDCRSRGPMLYPGPVQYFHGDWSWNNFYGHTPAFCWFIQDGLLSVTSESICTNYWLTACSNLPRKKCVRWTDRPPMTIAVDWDVKQQNKQYEGSRRLIILWQYFKYDLMTNWIMSHSKENFLFV